jgi:hypothetical protein
MKGKKREMKNEKTKTTLQQRDSPPFALFDQCYLSPFFLKITSTIPVEVLADDGKAQRACRLGNIGRSVGKQKGRRLDRHVPATEEEKKGTSTENGVVVDEWKG